jgi:hypothetical protein
MTAGEAGAAARTMIVPLALARFVASYPATKMVITLIGLVLGRAHPRQHVEAIEPASCVRAAPA